MLPHQAEQRGRITSPDLLATLFNAPQDSIGILGHKLCGSSTATSQQKSLIFTSHKKTQNKTKKTKMDKQNENNKPGRVLQLLAVLERFVAALCFFRIQLLSIILNALGHKLTSNLNLSLLLRRKQLTK